MVGTGLKVSCSKDELVQGLVAEPYGPPHGRRLDDEPQDDGVLCRLGSDLGAGHPCGEHKRGGVNSA